MCVSPGPGMTGEVTGDQPHERAAVVGRQQHEVVAGDRLVARLRELQRRREVHPELHAVRRPAVAQRALGRHLVVQDAATRGHPLRVALADDAATTVGVVVRDLAVEHVGDGLEPAVRVPGRALRLVGLVLDRAELVEEEERVGVVHAQAARERTPHLEAGALDGVVRGHGAQRGARHRRRRVGAGDAGEHERVLDGHCGHGGLLAFWLSLVRDYRRPT